MIAGLSIVNFVILCIVVAAVIAILYAFIQHSGIPIPPVFLKVFWIVLAAVVCIVGIKIVVSLF